MHPVNVRTFDDPRGAVAPAGLVADLESDVPLDPAAVTRAADEFAASAGVGADYSLVVAGQDGTVALDRNGAVAREPASTMKTITAFAASLALDTDSTLDTETRLVTDGGTATVTLTGHGNMLLGSGESDPDHVNGRAGLGTLARATAQALEAQGITVVNLAYDGSLFGAPVTPAGIEQNNGDHRYATPVTAMAVDGGRIWGAEARPSDPDDGHVYPELSFTTVEDAAKVFAERLAEQGITVNGTPAAGATPDAEPIATVRSATIGELMTYALRNSDNTQAELLGRLVALRDGAENSPAGAVAAVRARLQQAGIPMDGLVMADCSGLTPGSTATVETLLQVQIAAMRSGNATAAFAEGLPVSGLTGTLGLATRGFTADAKGLVRGKTGSLTGVRSLAGNVSRRSGGILYFAVIVNNSQDPASAVTAIDRLASALSAL
nr:D-alanyl-D-alanine carboxypeptidase/D-alanyl-D-alanine-endopeptidase [Bifidobacterium sp. DSM 109958]